MVDLEGGAERVELVRAGRGALSQLEPAVGELLSVVGQNGADADGTYKCGGYGQVLRRSRPSGPVRDGSALERLAEL